VWHEIEADVTVEMVQRVLQDNVETGREVVRRLAEAGLPHCDAGCRHALDGAVITDPSLIPEDARARVAFLFSSPGTAQER
jgi:5'-methylthioadenosine phosphorylase